MAASIQSEHQFDTLRLYSALMEQREKWGGKLVLACGPDCALSGIAPAVSIAGGACLAIEADAAAAKAAMRLGEFDFVVNTLDEALRTLKNEIRRHRPLSVAVTTGVSSALAEAVERGLQPDLLLIASHQPAASILEDACIGVLRDRGMSIRQIHSGEAAGPVGASPQNTNFVYLPAASAVDLKFGEDRLLALLPPDDLVRRRWVQQAPRYLRDARNGGRWIWLSREEQAQLAL